MTTLYLWDERGYYYGSVEVDDAAPLPPRSTPTKPPKLKATEVAQWTGSWVKVNKSVVEAHDTLIAETLVSSAVIIDM